MPERPLILFPTPEDAARIKRKRPIPQPSYPSITRQYDRLNPCFNVLRQAFQQKAVTIQNSPTGINPEFALVFEVIGSVENFYTAVKKVEGLEWMFEASADEIEPDADFFNLDEDGQREESYLAGRVYCVMSNQEAMNQMLSLWDRYVAGETSIFERGFAGLRDVFVHIKTIRPWGPADRIYETHVMEYWKENLEIDGDHEVPFEIELFFRNDPTKRRIAYETITNAVIQLGGAIHSQSIIESINYHSILVVLPRRQVQLLVDTYDQISLVAIDDIMFFRPTSQAVVKGYEDTYTLDTQAIPAEMQPLAEPVIGIFDGMPIQNHRLLSGKLIVDDPDNYENNYLEKYRCHGTAMSSLIVYGDLNRNDQVHNRKIYFRPVLKPVLDFWGNSEERVPSDIIFVDLIHRAVRRMFEGEGTTPAAAPSIKVINISIGDPARQLTSIMSPLARLLDWLSYKYKVLFIVSAGNQNTGGLNIGVTFDEFKGLNQQQRNECVFSHLINEIRNLRVLCPAESINSLTIGALYADACQIVESERQIAAVSDGLPSPISSFGLGYNRTINPDLYYYGGRKLLIRSTDGGLRWPLSAREPGCKVAAPYGDGAESGQAFSFGTSDATAQITHEAGKCFDVLSEIFINETGHSIPSNYAAILLKGMLTHGAKWDLCADEISRLTQLPVNRLQRWLGNGIPNISRVMECTRRRITLIGLGSLQPENAHVYTLPLPFDFSSRLIKRRLTVTLSYFSPIVPTKQRYRASQLWFEIEQPHTLFPDRQNTDWNSVRRGTLQHEIFSGENAVVWNTDDCMKIKVNCKKDADNCRDAIPYGLFVTFEVARGIELDVYTEIVNRIQQMVPVTTIGQA